LADEWIDQRPPVLAWMSKWIVRSNGELLTAQVSSAII